MFLTRDQILQANDLPREEVQVPEWGGSIFVRSLTVGERLKLEEKSQTESGGHSVVRLITMAACDEHGVALFEDSDIELLRGKSARAFLRVKEAANRLNALTDRDLEDIEKN